MIRDFLRWRSLSLTLVASLLIASCAHKKGFLGAKADLHPDDKKRASAIALFEEGSELLFKDNEKAALKFKEALQKDESFLPALYNAGLAAELLGNDEKAIQFYQRCLKLNKEEPSCFSNLVLLEHKNKHEEALNALINAYTDEFPGEPFVLVAKAKLALAQGDLQKAEQDARAALERNAENVEALYVMARIFYEQKNYAAARFVAKNALDLAPSHGQLHLLLGHVFTDLKLLHDALDSYEQAVKFYPTEEALETYGLLLLRRGRAPQALEVLKRLSEFRPNVSRHHLHVGNAYRANKMYEEARASYLKALKLDAQDKDIDFNLGLLFYDWQPADMKAVDRFKLAARYFESYLEKPGLPQDRVIEVQAYLKKLNQKIEAEELATQVPELEPDENSQEEAKPEAP